ncbi:MAG: zinc-ribbon domain-containing protein [Rickettsiales bacterium]|jgi:hypothetical protein|nr:zinc-ribbon domain-containing protein [Rickettsiales bacterium]
MIIICPKCKAEFDVDPLLLDDSKDFQCSECEFVWSREEAVSHKPAEMERSKLLRGLGLAVASEPRAGAKIFSLKNLGFFLIGSAFVALATLAVDKLAGGGAASRGVFSKQEEKVDTTRLYVEVNKNPELFKEGMNNYIMVTGSVINPTEKAMPVPKIIVRLLNRDRRPMQEQEREIDTKVLGPGEDAYFRFKILKFSDKIEKLSVDLADEKI